MTRKAYSAGLCAARLCAASLAAVMVVTAVAASPAAAQARKEQNVATATRGAGASRARTRVVVERRSFLDAGTEVLPGQRKFLDYAFPPTHTPMDVVQNTGGRVGWHNSPLPGPFFPWW
jgi:hypothetical protein